MTAISDTVEKQIQESMRKTRPILIDGAVIYMLSFQAHKFVRYAESSKNLTTPEFGSGDWPISNWWCAVPDFIRSLFVPRMYVLALDRPVCWDNENNPIPEEQLQLILSRITRAMKQSYPRSEVLLKG